jgi:hypothetical protein
MRSVCLRRQSARCRWERQKHQSLLNSFRKAAIRFGRPSGECLFFGVPWTAGEFRGRRRVQHSDSLGQQKLVDSQQGEAALGSSHLHRRPAGQHCTGNCKLRPQDQHFQPPQRQRDTHCHVQDRHCLHGSFIRQTQTHFYSPR